MIRSLHQTRKLFTVSVQFQEVLGLLEHLQHLLCTACFVQKRSASVTTKRSVCERCQIGLLVPYGHAGWSLANHILLQSPMCLGPSFVILTSLHLSSLQPQEIGGHPMYPCTCTYDSSRTTNSTEEKDRCSIILQRQITSTSIAFLSMGLFALFSL